MMEWNADPILIQLGPLAIRYYSLMFIIGFMSMGYYGKQIFIAHGKSPKIVDSFINYLILGMIVGARLAHCFFYDPGYYLNHPLEVLMVWKGGLASHGGYLGIFVATMLFVRKYKKIKLLWLLDILTGPAVFVGGLIRLGNFMNSEILGKATDVPWAIIFKRVDDIPRHPAQLYESIGYFLCSFLFMYLARKSSKLHMGAVVSVSFVIGFTFRFFIEFTKDNQSALSESLPINMGQILSLGLVVLGFLLYGWTKKRSAQNK